VFAYGSLVGARSVEELLGREVGGSRQASLGGWRRRWSLKRDNLACEKTFARRDDGRKPTWILGLNLEPAAEPTAGPNGLLIPASEGDLARFDLREMRYDRVDVSDQVLLADTTPGTGSTAGPDRVPSGESTAGFDRVITYVAKPEHFAPDPPDDAVILRTYVRVVEQAFADLGESELRTYAATTDQPPVEVVDGVLVADAIPAGNPRDW
jgi:hypothetical protein